MASKALQIVSHNKVRACVAARFLRTAVVLAITFSMLANSVLASPLVGQAMVEAAAGWEQELKIRLYAAGWLRVLPVASAMAQAGWDGKGAPPNVRPGPITPETKEARERRVARVRIFPGDLTIETAQPAVFNAVAYDSKDLPISGLNFTWEAFDEVNKAVVPVSQTGGFISGRPGTYSLTAQVAGIKSAVKITVTGMPRIQPVRGTPLPQVTSSDKPRPGTAPEDDPYTYTWNQNNYTTLDDPGTERGDVPGHTADDGAGSGNFQFSAPMLGLDGRGLDLPLALNYNSRLWHKAGAEMYFDIDRDWIPGWSMGFGKIVVAGNTYMMIDGDGTRHSFAGIPYGNFGGLAGSLQSFEGYTTDGSFIHYYAEGYKTQFNGGYILKAWAMLPNGTRIEYGAPVFTSNGNGKTGAIYPKQIRDANGNFISITYRRSTVIVNGQPRELEQGPEIETITDTLGRLVRFHYDENNLLTAVTAPALGGFGRRTVVRLTYASRNLADAGPNYGFAGVTTRVRSAVISTIRAIYYPATNTGYWFGDADSYSKYGMIRKLSERRGMSFNGPAPGEFGPTGQGEITAGFSSREMVYRNLTLPGYSDILGALTDVPTYTRMTEDWYGRQTATIPTTKYQVNNLGGTIQTLITKPNGVVIEQITNNDQNSPYYGLLFEDRTYKDETRAVVLHGSRVTWERVDETDTTQSATGPLHCKSPRPSRTEVTDERGQTMITTYSYGSFGNQVENTISFKYDGATQLQQVRTQYQNGMEYRGNWINRGLLWWHPGDLFYGGADWSGPHIFNLATSTDVYGADDFTPASSTRYFYDQQPGSQLQATPGAAQHVAAPNQRGNVTMVKRYADAAGQNESTAIVETRGYDDCGNVIRVSTSCCEQTSFQYSAGTQYAWPESIVRGSATDAAQQVRTRSVVDLATGLQLESYDGNDRRSNTVYNALSLRPEYEYGATGAYAYHIYDDTNVILYDFLYPAGQSGFGFAARSDKYPDGYGRLRAEVAYGIGYSVDRVDTVYDEVGRTARQSRPFTGTAAQQWYSYTYDELDRVKRVTAPDGSVSERFYNEAARPAAASGGAGQTMRARDPWGRERWARFDELDRLVEVVEPDDTSAGSVASGGYRTEYQYDILGNLTQVAQGAQQRRFRYDSLSRLTHQKLAERDATIRDNGSYAGLNNGGAWSDTFAYDTRSNLVSSLDARGVLTTFNYNNDPLGRLRSVNYAIPAGANIAATAGVMYEYMTTGDLMRLRKVTDGMGFEEFAYDSEGRMYQKTRSFTGRTGNELVTNYLYDTLDRVSKIIYPHRYRNTGLRQEVVPEYDVASRLNALKLDNNYLASQINYNASSQTTSLQLGNGTIESYNYDEQNGLLNRQQITLGATTHLDLSYGYTRAGSTTKTGQLTQILDQTPGNNGNRNRSFEYDALARLKKAAGTRNGQGWAQEYRYDRYGNRTQVTATGSLTSKLDDNLFEVPLPRPTLKDQVAFNHLNINARWAAQAKDRSRLVTDASIGARRSMDLATAAPQINRLPVSDPGGPYAGNVGQPISFNGSRSYDPDGSIVSYLWNFGDGTQGSGAYLSHTYAAPGTYTVSLRVRDNRNASRTATTTATIGGGGGNQSPIANAGGPYGGSVGTSISFNGTGSADPDGTITSYSWNFGDGTSGSGPTPTKAYGTAGAYTVTLTVTDNAGATGSATATATITAATGNQPPVARPGGPYSGTAGTSIRFDGSASSDPNGTITAYAWTFGDGTTGTGATPSKVYSAAGSYTVTLTVTDNQGATNSASTTAVIGSAGITPNYEGFLDIADCTLLTGWAADRNRLNTSINVDVYDGATLLAANVAANQSRPDVGAYLGDNGLHGYTFSIPSTLRDGQPHSLSVKFAGTQQSLIGSPKTLTCAPPQTTNNAGFVAQSVPATMTAGQQYTVSVTMSNSGTSTWSASGNYKLGSQNPQDTNAWGLNRVAIPGSLAAPGVNVPFSFTITAPATPGTYNFQWQMVQEGVGWFGAKSTNVAVTVTGAAPPPPTGPLTDGAPSLSYTPTNNRITSYTYDAAGNETRAQSENGVWQTYLYDAANRLVRVSSDGGAQLAQYYYGADNRRQRSDEAGTTWYAWDDGNVIGEFGDSGTQLTWQLSRIYLGNRLLAEVKPAGLEYHHPDRLGTRLVTDGTGQKITEQVTLPYGTALASESSGTPTKRRFTSYDRGTSTRLDYAINRYYSSWQGRFTQVDPIGMGASRLEDPQSLNLYAYCGNDPVNCVDPDGLFFKRLFGAIKKFFSNTIVKIAAVVALTVISLGLLGPLTASSVVGTINLGGGAVATAVGATHLTVLGWAAVGLAALSGVSIPSTITNWGFSTPPINPDTVEQNWQGKGGGSRGTGGGRGSGSGGGGRGRNPGPYRSRIVTWARILREALSPARPRVIRFPEARIFFRGLVQNRPLRELTDAEIYNAFRQTGYTPTSHFIMRLRSVRTQANGITTLNDFAKHFNLGEASLGNYGRISISYGRLETIVEVTATQRVLVTITP